MPALRLRPRRKRSEPCGRAGLGCLASSDPKAAHSVTENMSFKNWNAVRATPRVWWRGARPAVVVGLLGALAAWALFGGGWVNIDAMNSLLWGHQLASGRLPDYGNGPTPHPLSNLVALLASPLGPGRTMAAARPQLPVVWRPDRCHMGLRRTRLRLAGCPRRHPAAAHAGCPELQHGAGVPRRALRGADRDGRCARTRASAAGALRADTACRRGPASSRSVVAVWCILALVAPGLPAQQPHPLRLGRRASARRLGSERPGHHWGPALQPARHRDRGPTW
jgi:hypothetical protein